MQNKSENNAMIHCFFKTTCCWFLKTNETNNNVERHVTFKVVVVLFSYRTMYRHPAPPPSPGFSRYRSGRYKTVFVQFEYWLSILRPSILRARITSCAGSGAGGGGFSSTQRTILYTGRKENAKSTSASDRFSGYATYLFILGKDQRIIFRLNKQLVWRL